jgi:transcriptional regulator with XRE-family HTH domain
MNTLGDRLQKLREGKKLSKSNLGKLVSVHYSQIGRYERNEATPSAEALKNLANTLEVSTDFLMNGDVNNLAKDNIQNKKLINLFSRITKLSQDDQHVITSLIEAYTFKQEMKQQLAS